MNILDKPEKQESEKKYATAIILSGIFGTIGVHHFYAERWGMGILDLGMFSGTLGLYISGNFILAAILFFIDLVHTIFVTYQLLVGQYKDGHGKLITYPGQQL